jgi:ABC-2 type transport system ATP-binding protein/lipopolysaccharide transport system ATP-binding protein
MKTHAIEVERLGKRYPLGRRLGQYETLRDTLATLGRSWSRDTSAPDIWALRDVALSVDEGEAVGIVGRNGAGKTTLLKILARITEPTLGVSRTRGRVGSLLEVGTGFHPELTGRDNVYLNGAILGMSRQEIRRRFDEIVAFSGVASFLDTPLKRYSAGMQLRLAFAVAAHLEPDIVLVDEVLAVGDVEFQQKCLGRMSELEHEGRTLVFVSHDLGAIRQLCPRSLWIDDGQIVADGRTQDVVERYLAAHAPRGIAAEPRIDPSRAVVVEHVALTDGTGAPIEPGSDEPFDIRVAVLARQRVPDLDAAIYLIDGDGTRVLDEAWHERGGALLTGTPPQRLEVSVTVPGVLAPGEYVIGVWIASEDECFFFEEVLTFRIRERVGDRRASVDKKRIVRSLSGLQIRFL